MQILENSSFGLRSAYRLLEGEQNKPRIHLFPMVHFATSSFYEDVLARLQRCDLILVEGVRTKSLMQTRQIFKSISRNKRLGLVPQKSLEPSQVRGKIINVDVSAEEFEYKWSQKSFAVRFGEIAISPSTAFYLRYIATRRDMAKVLGMDDKVSRREILQSSEHQEDWDDVIVAWRDSELLKKLETQLSDPLNIDQDIAIVFGAHHMRAVIRYLCHNLDFHISQSDWMTVFEF